MVIKLKFAIYSILPKNTSYKIPGHYIIKGF